MNNKNTNKTAMNIQLIWKKAKSKLFFASMNIFSSSEISEFESDSESDIIYYNLSPPLPPLPQLTFEVEMFRTKEEGKRPNAHGVLFREMDVQSRHWIDQQVDE